LSAQKIYAAMRQSEMCNWVGDGDPAIIGAANFTCLVENLPLRRDDVVLDFGCGIGRTSVLLAEFLEGGQVVGSDIVPGQIRFCQDQFAQFFPNATFHCIRASNPAYDARTAMTADEALAIDEELFFQKYSNVFEIVVAFSVFTHFDPTMASRYLKYLRGVTKPGGHLLLTWFLDHPGNPTESRLVPGQNFLNPDGNLGFAIFSLAAVLELSSSAGLLVETISYGTWRGAPTIYKGQHGQDIVVLRLPFELPIEFDANIYLAIHKDVAQAGVDPLQHYITHGCREGRRLR
jgi:SAM-dependent methyltransferase